MATTKQRTAHWLLLGAKIRLVVPDILTVARRVGPTMDKVWLKRTGLTFCTGFFFRVMYINER